MFDEPRDALYLLQRWYVGQCNSEWEHGCGVRIETLDNPGWTLTVELTGTGREGVEVDRAVLERSEHDWVHWSVEGNTFQAACGPTNLNEAVLIFLDFVGARGSAIS